MSDIDRPSPLTTIAGWIVLLSFCFFWFVGVFTFIGWVF
jgi:hypothetical protein